MRRFIITDLTRFATKEDVCTAVIDIETGECLRPIPYLKSARCAELNLQPGAVLEGEINLRADAVNPHIEDADHSNLVFIGPSSAQEFKNILDRTLSTSVSNGFGIEFLVDQKHIPIGVRANCSIITIKVQPSQIQIREDGFKAGKIRVSFLDESGHQFRFLSITDRGFYDYAEKHQADGSLPDLEEFVKSQNEIYLRVGVSRAFAISGRNGYWLQVNGVYTFPDFHKEIRSYQ